MLIELTNQEIQGNAEFLGGKGYGLWWMQQQGINVPPALVIPTTVCVEYMKAPKTTMKKVAMEVKAKLAYFKDIFGYMPLLSVRSGARVSMPGMMDTILNVGLDTTTKTSWEQRIGTDCVNDSYKRLIVMYGNVVKGIDRKKLEKHTLPETLSAYEREAQETFPGVADQIINSVEAVFKSWNNDRAKTYRKMNNIPNEWGTAVVIQAMVFGNLNDNSGTGVLFTRDPDTGDDKVVGEFLTNAQGEDVVAGIRTPMPLSKMAEWNEEVSTELLKTVIKLEELKRDVQDVEFTIQDGKLYILQTRNAKRSAAAAVKIAMDMQSTGLISESEMLQRVSQRELDLANMPVIDTKFKKPADFTGIPACSGIQTGVVALDSKTAMQLAQAGQKVILVTEETTPDDIGGMAAAVGVLTMTGGSTSHAAVVARSMNRTCVVGLGKEHHHQFKAGMQISIDGATGRVWFGEVPVVGGNNPLVAKFKSVLMKGITLIVESSPEFHVDRLVLELGNILHFNIKDIMETVEKCVDKCDKLDFSVTRGVSTDFYTDEDFEARAKAVLGEAKNALTAKDSTCYGMEVHGFLHSPLVDGSNLDLATLVMAKTDVMLVQSIAAKALSPAHIKVIDWLKQDGIGIGVWNHKDSASPKYYSVATQK